MNKIHSKNLTKYLSLGVIFLIFWTISWPKIDTGALKSDATLAIYASQQIANGQSPYSNYIIMHPPIAHLLGALAIAFGRIFSITDVISIKIFSLILSTLILGSVYILGEKFEKGLGALSALGASFNLLVLMVAWGMHIKLVMLLFFTAMLIMLASQRWLLAGIFFGGAMFSWGGGFFFSLIAGVVWLVFNHDRKKSVWQFLLGLLLVVISLVFILILFGSLVDFEQQYLLTIRQYMINKLTGEGIADAGIGFKNILDSSNVTPPDLIVLLGGVGALIAFVIKNRGLLRSQISVLVVIVSIVVPVIMVYFDYQSPFDLLPLIPGVSILFSWVIKELIEKWVAIWHTEITPIYIILVAIMLVVTRVISFPALPDRLQTQITAAKWIENASSGVYEIQSIGDLSIQVLSEMENSTPVIHAGPKTFLAMQNNHWTLDRLEHEWSNENIGIISIDVRNINKNYLNPLLQYLENDFELIGYSVEPTMYLFASKNNSQAALDAMGFIQLNSSKTASELSSAKIIPVDELSMVSPFVAFHLDETHTIFSYSFEKEFKIYWWTQPQTLMQGVLGIRWLSEEEEIESDWNFENIEWQPGFASISTFELPGDMENWHQVEICIIEDLDGYGDPICRGETAIFEITP